MMEMVENVQEGSDSGKARTDRARHPAADMNQSAAPPESRPPHWRTIYQVHPVAAVFPALPPEELQQLADSIKQTGLMVPITVWHGDGGDFVLDGLNRLAALERAGVPFQDPDGRFQSFVTGGKLSLHPDPAGLAIAKNIARRHLSAAERAELAVKALEAGRSKTGERSPVSKGGRGKKGRAREVADLAKVDRKTAREQLDVQADPGLKGKRERGELTAEQAGRAIREQKAASRGKSATSKPKTATAAAPPTAPSSVPTSAPPTVPTKTPGMVSKLYAAFDDVNEWAEEIEGDVDKVPPAERRKLRERIGDAVNRLESLRAEVAPAQRIGRSGRWSAAVSAARDALEEFESAMAELTELRDEYGEWKGNLPENMQASATAEKLEAVCDLDFDCFDAASVRGVLDEAEALELPVGFGRD